MHRLKLLLLLTGILPGRFLFAQATDTCYLLKPDCVFDGERMHSGWQVLVEITAYRLSEP